METVTFITSLFTFYIKGEISIDSHFVKLKKPNTILSIIPMGAKKESIPANQISSVGTNFKMIFGNFLIGLILACISFGQLTNENGSIFAGIILILLGGLYIVNSFQTKLIINTTSGQIKEINFLDKKKADMAENMINILIANRM